MKNHSGRSILGHVFWMYHIVGVLFFPPGELGREAKGLGRHGRAVRRGSDYNIILDGKSPPSQEEYACDVSPPPTPHPTLPCPRQFLCACFFMQLPNQF